MNIHTNTLYYGDCLQIMEDMQPNSVDLIYLDPPFNSNRAYNSIYKDSTGRPLPSQVNAFCDMWELTPERIDFLENMHTRLQGRDVSGEAVSFWQYFLNSIRESQPKLLAYCLYMLERLIIMKNLLKETGSIYLHCDQSAGHYLKILLDSVFGVKNFRNEIIWGYSGNSKPTKHFPRKHDNIFFYAKNREKSLYNPIILEYSEATKKRYNHIDADGKKYKISALRNGKQEVVYMSDGVHATDVWSDIPVIRSKKERLGWPTQKPIELLKRIIKSSSNEGDIVFDPFCGCATTICAAYELNRKWIGVDIAYHAIKRVVQNRLADFYGLNEGEHYEVAGIPNTMEAARDIWSRDKYQFQRWVVELIHGFVTAKQTADGGGDGRIFFQDPAKKELQTMVLEVKGGKNINIEVVRNLRGAMERENLRMAGLILLEELSDRKRKNFLNEMANAGTIEVCGKQYHKMQMLTTKEILEGKRFEMPSIAVLREKEVQPRLPNAFNRES